MIRYVKKNNGENKRNKKFKRKERANTSAMKTRLPGYHA